MSTSTESPDQTKGQQDGKRETKLVRIRLSAYRRLEYTELLEVPSDITPEQLERIPHHQASDVCASEFIDDPDYWENGDSRAEFVEGENVTACGSLSIDGDDNIVVTYFDEELSQET